MTRLFPIQSMKFHNRKELRTLEMKNRLEMKNLIKRLNAFDLSAYYREQIIRDLIGYAKECEQRNETIAESLESSLYDFARSLADNGTRKKWTIRLLEAIFNILWIFVLGISWGMLAVMVMQRFSEPTNFAHFPVTVSSLLMFPILATVCCLRRHKNIRWIGAGAFILFHSIRAIENSSRWNGNERLTVTTVNLWWALAISLLIVSVVSLFLAHQQYQEFKHEVKQ